MSDTNYRVFFGDADYTFDLVKPELIRELEAVTGAGIGALCIRVIETRQFRHADLEHVIRLGLIGGGTDPETAARLVTNYLPARPLAEAQILATAVLSALWFGAAPVADPDALAVLGALSEAVA